MNTLSEYEEDGLVLEELRKISKGNMREISELKRQIIRYETLIEDAPQALVNLIKNGSLKLGTTAVLGNLNSKKEHQLKKHLYPDEGDSIIIDISTERSNNHPSVNQRRRKSKTNKNGSLKNNNLENAKRVFKSVDRGLPLNNHLNNIGSESNTAYQ